MKSVVCLSGGLDSVASLHWAKKKHEEVQALFFDYGQKALLYEREAARFFCNQLKVSFKEVNLGFLGEISPSALNQKDKAVPTSEVQIHSKEQSLKTAQSVWVPNRNGLFLNVAAAYVEALGFDAVVVGFNLEEAQTFSDNSKEFLNKMNLVWSHSTQNGVRAISPTVHMNKVEIFKLAQDLNVDIERLWPCYQGTENWCLECESCKRFLRAQKEAKT